MSVSDELLGIGVVFAALLWLAAARFKGTKFLLACTLLYVLFLAFNLWLFIYARKLPLPVTPTLGFAFSILAIGACHLYQVERDRSDSLVRMEAGGKLEALNRELMAQKRALERANEKLAQADRLRTSIVQNADRELQPGAIPGRLPADQVPIVDAAARHSRAVRR